MHYFSNKDFYVVLSKSCMHGPSPLSLRALSVLAPAGLSFPRLELEAIYTALPCMHAHAYDTSL